ncbi:hypothetical protein [Paraburkholderia susongensis]|uniref:Uncharacterized protein n=1 Tax=Paraburkholderia susongensis TaxID=1515439 RepID=A0A1X7LWS4_9BURK|nr:hypothetical protein [Paraburkholderia susongensis]SMG57964.1 hypothetical protein SAMN06265784_110145 [Paraburkholderia susongensis]
MYAVRILVSAWQKSSDFRASRLNGAPKLRSIARRAADAVTLRFMHSGPTFRLRPPTSARAAFPSVASVRVDASRGDSIARANRCSLNVGAKAKKQPLI